MYRRYQPGQRNPVCQQGKPPVGEMERIKKQQMQRSQENKQVEKSDCSIEKICLKTKQEKRENPILDLLPPMLFNKDTKKVFGMFSAEDLLLVALILLLLDSNEKEDSFLIYLLVYVLLSDYIDLPI